MQVIISNGLVKRVFIFSFACSLDEEIWKKEEDMSQSFLCLSANQVASRSTSISPWDLRGNSSPRGPGRVATENPAPNPRPNNPLCTSQKPLSLVLSGCKLKSGLFSQKSLGLKAENLNVCRSDSGCRRQSPHSEWNSNRRPIACALRTFVIECCCISPGGQTWVQQQRRMESMWKRVLR